MVQSISHRQVLPMQRTARLFNCARCRCPVTICSRCDHGHIYCGPRCSRTARSESLRKAGCRYQNTWYGRRLHAARQRRYRQRQNQKVTHQGSLSSPPDDSLCSALRECTGEGEKPAAARKGGIRCHFCDQSCSEYVRLDFLGARDPRPHLERPPVYPAPPVWIRGP